jgi:3-oxoacid CoA-transferase subunit B
MLLSGDKDRMIKRAAREVLPGMTVNLGIGYPTRIVDYLGRDCPVCLHSENGISGQGPALPYGQEDRNLIDAGGTYVSTLPGTAFFDSAVSFALVRGGRLDLTILGALQIGSNGDLANWTIPGKFTPGVGGGMELAQKARRVVALSTHLDKRGRSKIVSQCTLPLTAPACVDRICTDMAVIDITADGLVLREIAEGLSIDDVVSATDVPLLIPECDLTTF